MCRPRCKKGSSPSPGGGGESYALFRSFSSLEPPGSFWGPIYFPSNPGAPFASFLGMSPKCPRCLLRVDIYTLPWLLDVVLYVSSGVFGENGSCIFVDCGTASMCLNCVCTPKNAKIHWPHGFATRLSVTYNFVYDCRAAHLDEKVRSLCHIQLCVRWLCCAPGRASVTFGRLLI